LKLYIFSKSNFYSFDEFIDKYANIHHVKSM
jgi:hypothetical protein